MHVHRWQRLRHDCSHKRRRRLSFQKQRLSRLPCVEASCDDLQLAAGRLPIDHLPHGPQQLELLLRVVGRLHRPSVRDVLPRHESVRMYVGHRPPESSMPRSRLEGMRLLHTQHGSLGRDLHGSQVRDARELAMPAIAPEDPYPCATAKRLRLCNCLARRKLRPLSARVRRLSDATASVADVGCG